MKKIWNMPRILVQEFEANEYVAACYQLGCKVYSDHDRFDESNWNYKPKGTSWTDHSGDCTNPNKNFITTDETGLIIGMYEMNTDQGRLDADMDKWIDVNNDKKCNAGDIIFWHTVSDNRDRRWNHWAIAQTADPSHPNRS